LNFAGLAAVQGRFVAPLLDAIDVDEVLIWSGGRRTFT